MKPEFSYELDSDVVARYLISLDNQRDEPDVTHLKLQKLLYFAQANYLASTGRRLIATDTEAFAHGPVMYPVYTTYKDYGREIIAAEHHPDFDISEMPEDAREFVSAVWMMFKDQSASQLRNVTHAQSPWKENFEPGAFRRQIPDESMIDYFRSKVPRRERVLHPNVVLVDQTVLDDLDDREDEIVARTIRALSR